MCISDDSFEMKSNSNCGAITRQWIWRIELVLLFCGFPISSKKLTSWHSCLEKSAFKIKNKTCSSFILGYFLFCIYLFACLLVEKHPCWFPKWKDQFTVASAVSEGQRALRRESGKLETKAKNKLMYVWKCHNETHYFLS